MNFVDPKEYDIPGLVRKNRYKTILPSEYMLPWGGEGSEVLSSGKSSSPGPLGMMNEQHRRCYGGWDNQEREEMSRDCFTFYPWILVLPGQWHRMQL